MPSREIPRSRWREFLDSFSRQHKGWLATLEIMGREASPADEENPLPLVSVAQREGEADAVTVTLGDAASRVEHTIENAARLVFDEDFEGRHRGLDVESLDGERTILRFRAAVAPEMLESLLDEEH